MSKEQPKWVKRNADVLAQLLQSGTFSVNIFQPGGFDRVDSCHYSLQWFAHDKFATDIPLLPFRPDEPEEVTVVKKALLEHLDMDSKVTLGVLCDQLVPTDEPMDEEEKAIRDRLGSLVLAFIAGEAKRAIIERHASRAGNEQEQVLIDGLVKVMRFVPSVSSKHSCSVS